MTVANLRKALEKGRGVNSPRPSYDPYFREPPPLPWWVVLDPLARLAAILLIVFFLMLTLMGLF